MKTITIDGNGAASYVSYALSELIIIYPITPSTPMAEQADIWSTGGKENVFKSVPQTYEMQSESGVAGALHGALTCGALATTYTCSQGLLLMLPNMYKMAGELLPTVFHVSARALSTHALNIFGDHQDVMAVRACGFAMLCSSTVQETMDFALVAHAASLKSEIPFLHFFDGFRTSHETCKIQAFEENELLSVIDKKDIERFKARALSPNQPVQRGTAQNGDVYFQNREAANDRYDRLPIIVKETMNKLVQICGRKYDLFDYFGAEDAKHVIVMMGSGAGTMYEIIEKLNEKNAKIGLIKVRLYRPFDSETFLSKIPHTCTRIAVLDRTKESGAQGEPLYQDVCTALLQSGKTNIRVVGGRYGLGGKEFTPDMAYAVIKNLADEQPKNHFTVGIDDDKNGTSLSCDQPFDFSADSTFACKFYGLGSDGSVGANKNTIKIIGENTPLYVQGYFQYDSRKSGGITVSHLRFGKKEIFSAYLVDRADFTACHNPSYLTRLNMLKGAKENGVFLLNCPWKTDEEIAENIPASVAKQILKKHLRLFVIDATQIARECGLDGRTSTIMQAAFFYLNPHLLAYETAVEKLKEKVRATYLKKGEAIVQNNFHAIDKTQAALREIPLQIFENAQPKTLTKHPSADDKYYQNFMRPILHLQGDELPVSAFNVDGTYKTSTAKLEKHGAPLLLPKWIESNCIQCAQCSFVCPHACIRPFAIPNENAEKLSFPTIPAVGIKNAQFTIRVSPLDCMGCGVCANVCPAKEKALVMTPASELTPTLARAWEDVLSLPKADTSSLKRNTVKGSQFYPPLFEFSYACSGCGETAYIKVLTQLFGEKAVIANATGCSSIYGGSAPCCPYSVNADGKGPAWASSLFEDNAEFGFGMRLAYDFQNLGNKRSVWCVGGDGWAYDIGYGGLDHVLAMGKNLNILVLDSEVYSNTGGQTSKSTPLGAVARFSMGGKRTKKKELGLMAMQYKNVYVAQVSIGANKAQFLTALTEAEAYDGPSLIIAYTPCIAHGVPMQKSVEEEKLAVECGYFPLFRYNPTLKEQGKNPFILDSKAPTRPLREFLENENRFASLKRTRPQDAEILFTQAEKDCAERFAYLQRLAQWQE